MPLVEPGNGALREKILVCGGGGAGKSTLHLSIAWWAKQSGDTRKFLIMDTDDEAILQVMNEPKYEGMLVQDGGNVEVHSVRSWSDYLEFSAKAVANCQFGDWIILDFITHAWAEAQNGFLEDAVQKTREQVLYEAGVSGATGWDMYKTSFNWQAVNGSYFSFLKPILLKSRAHVFMVAEEQEIQDNKNTPADAKEHLAQFGKWKASGQKSLAYQCRTYLRLQRLARGRVLFTLKDRARRELTGDTLSPDFMCGYLRDVAGWSITSTE